MPACRRRSTRSRRTVRRTATPARSTLSIAALLRAGLSAASSATSMPGRRGRGSGTVQQTKKRGKPRFFNPLSAARSGRQQRAFKCGELAKELFRPAAAFVVLGVGGVFLGILDAADKVGAVD